MRDVRRSQSCVPEDCLGMIWNNVLKVDEDGISTRYLIRFLKFAIRDEQGLLRFAAKSASGRIHLMYINLQLSRDRCKIEEGRFTVTAVLCIGLQMSVNNAPWFVRLI